MSYCRWSSFDFQCDVYVYGSAEGYVTHVAATRVVFAEPLPADVPWDDIDLWFDRHVKIMAIIDRSDRRPIGLAHDGRTFIDPDPQSCAARLESLRDLGYTVPQGAIDALRSEAAEMNHGGAEARKNE